MQDEYAIEGLDYIQDLLVRYRLTQLVLTESQSSHNQLDDLDIRSRLRYNMVDLYAQTLKFQFLLMKQYSRGSFKRIVRDMAGLDDWPSMLKELKATEAKAREQVLVCSSMRQVPLSIARSITVNCRRSWKVRRRWQLKRPYTSRATSLMRSSEWLLKI